MRLLSWNVQWCRGIDGRVDPQRIAAEAKRLADPDVLCLQEVAVNFAQLEGSSGEDQVSLLKREMGDYEAFFVPAVDLPGKRGRRQFGNLVLSRLPVGRVMRHALPWPAAESESMPRAALEVMLEAPFGFLRVTTTHLEFYSGEHRGAQVARLAELHAEARGESALLCGDFNLKPEDPLHRKILDAGFVDAWPSLHRDKPRQDTFHLYDGKAPYCCDYVFITPELAPRLKSVRIDAQTQASDHQPVIVELD